MFSGGPGRPRAGQGARGGGEPGGPRRRAPGACPARAPAAGRARRARLSAQSGRPCAARPASRRGAPGPLRVACSPGAGLGPNGPRRDPAAAAAAAAACHGWRQLCAALLPPRPDPARLPEGAPSPRRRVREALAPPDTQPGRCPFWAQERASWLQGPACPLHPPRTQTASVSFPPPSTTHSRPSSPPSSLSPSAHPACTPCFWGFQCLPAGLDQRCLSGAPCFGLNLVHLSGV